MLTPRPHLYSTTHPAVIHSVMPNFRGQGFNSLDNTFTVCVEADWDLKIVPDTTLLLTKRIGARRIFSGSLLLMTVRVVEKTCTALL